MSLTRVYEECYDVWPYTRCVARKQINPTQRRVAETASEVPADNAFFNHKCISGSPSKGKMENLSVRPYETGVYKSSTCGCGSSCSATECRCEEGCRTPGCKYSSIDPRHITSPSPYSPYLLGPYYPMKTITMNEAENQLKKSYHLMDKQMNNNCKEGYTTDYDKNYVDISKLRPSFSTVSNMGPYNMSGKSYKVEGNYMTLGKNTPFVKFGPLSFQAFDYHNSKCQCLPGEECRQCKGNDKNSLAMTDRPLYYR